MAMVCIWKHANTETLSQCDPNEEIALHIKTCAEAGIDEATLFATQERQENLAYTRYVLDAGHSGDLLDLLAALAPCVMGYGEIGSHLAATKTSDTYAE